MSDDQAVPKHRRDSEEYLRIAEERYAINLSNGIYTTRCKQARHKPPVNDADSTCDDSSQKPPWTARVDTFVGIASLVVSLLTLAGLFVTATYTYLQWAEARRIADASICAAKTAANSLTLTRDVFKASQAAILEPEIYLIGGTQGGNGFINVTFKDIGHTAATNVEGEISLNRNLHGVARQRKTINMREAAIAESNVVSRFIDLGETLNTRNLASQDVTVRGSLSYGDGVDGAKLTFCKGLVIQAAYSSPAWYDCANIKTIKNSNP